MIDQPIHPPQLVVVFVRFRRIAVGQIDRCNPYRGPRGRNLGFEKPSVVVVGITRQPGRNGIDPQAGEDRHAIEGLLAVNGDVVSKGFEGCARKCGIDAFRFLQADDIRLAFLDPGDEIVETLVDRIHVPSLQCASPPLVCVWQRSIVREANGARSRCRQLAAFIR